MLLFISHYLIRYESSRGHKLDITKPNQTGNNSEKNRQESGQRRTSSSVKLWVCASAEAQRVSHVPRWAAVPFFVIVDFLYYHCGTGGEYTVVHCVHASSQLLYYCTGCTEQLAGTVVELYTVVHWVQSFYCKLNILCRHTSCTNTPIDHNKLFSQLDVS